MPQASPELRNKFPEGDSEAWEVLKYNYNDNRGVIFPKVNGYESTEREWDAICYLCDEWDYGYDPNGL